jgi:hypothetical protein
MDDKLKTLRLIEEIACHEMTMTDTPWNLVYKLAHNMTKPGCRKNHPAWDKAFRKSAKAAKL